MLVQLASAALALVGWMALEVVARPELRVVAVEVLTMASILSLPMTLGIAYTLPNFFRHTQPDERRTPGPWSGHVSIAALTCLVAGCAGVLIVLVIPRLTAPGLATTCAATIATAVLVSQLARIDGRLTLALAGAAVAPLAPLTWLLLGAGEIAERPGAVVFSFVSLAALLMLLCLTRAYGSSIRAVTRRAVYAVAPSTALVLHLLAFTVLMQGVRLLPVITGDDELLLEAHVPALVLGAAFTLVSSGQGVLAVKVQTAGDGSPRRRPSLLPLYVALGATGATAVMLVSIGVNVRDVAFVSPSTIAGAVGATAALTAYYRQSAETLRRQRTWVLPSASLAASGAFATVAMLLTPERLGVAGLVWLLAGAILFLALVLGLLERAHRPKSTHVDAPLVATGTTTAV